MKLHWILRWSELRPNGPVACSGILLFFGLGHLLAQAPTTGRSGNDEPWSTVRQDQILVQLRPGLPLQQAREVHTSCGGQLRRTFEAMGGTQVVGVPAGQTVRSLVAQYTKHPQVVFAEPDYSRRTALVPNDPAFLDGTLWGLHNYGQNGGTPGADIDAVAAWDILNSASNAIVAVLDTGARHTHEDLAANIWANAADGAHGTNSIAGTSEVNDDSTSGHGTIMAGIIGAVGNNGRGVTGVAWHLQMMPCKCFDSQGQSSDSAIIAALDYARAHGARVVSASFDGPDFGLALSNAIDSARSAGMIFVASTGNSGINIDVTPRYPSCYQLDNIVSVAYFTRSNTLGIFSNYGSTNADLAAPGDRIYSTFNSTDSAYWPPSSLPINLEGTSYAAAYVSGACALLCEAYPTESHTHLIARLLRGAEPVPALAGKCGTGGRLNLRNALSPPIQLQVLSAGGPGGFGLAVLTDPNRTCVIEAAPSIGAWSPIFTNTTDATGRFEFSDGLSPSFPIRFYRASAQP